MGDLDWPIRFIPFPKRSRRQPVVLSPEEVARLRSAATSRRATAVGSEITWAKLAAMAEGARLASKSLWQ